MKNTIRTKPLSSILFILLAAVLGIAMMNCGDGGGGGGWDDDDDDDGGGTPGGTPTGPEPPPCGDYMYTECWDCDDYGYCAYCCDYYAGGPDCVECFY